MLKGLQNKIAIQGFTMYMKGIQHWATHSMKKAIKAAQRQSDLSNLYTSIVGLPLPDFIDLYVDGNYRALCKDKTKPDSNGTFHGVDVIDLAYAAENINMQYIDACGTEENQRRIKLLGEKYKLESKLDRINAICVSLSIQYNEELVKHLKDIGIRAIVNPDNIEASIEAILTDAKRFQLELDRRNQLLEADKADGKKPDRDFFYDVVLEYGKGQKVGDLDVMGFAGIYRKLHERVKQQERNGRRKDK